MSTPVTPVEDRSAVLSDLGPLAWVNDELRKSLDGAAKAMRRFVRDAEMARGTQLTELDTSHLRIARQQLHQAVGALEMVGLPAPARMLRGMEALAQKFVERPELCSDEAATRVERASHALTEFLEAVLKGRNASSVGLFPQYRDVMNTVGAERIHPADLWPLPFRWQVVPADASVPALAYAAPVRARMDPAVLKVVKAGDAQAAQVLSGLCAGLAQGHPGTEGRCFWSLAAGYFQAIALNLLPADVYTKRTSSRILQQYAVLARGDAQPSEQLGLDLAFFCAQAEPQSAAPRLDAVRLTYGLNVFGAVNYEQEQFGRYDPAQLVVARKRIATATETWSALAGGDLNRLKAASEQFAAVAESIQKLQPESSRLAQALMAAIDGVVRSAAAPQPAVAMEVATTVLYLEAAYEDLALGGDEAAARSDRLALRLQHVNAGASAEPLESWMEELYRRVSDRQTIGSVVDELRASLGEVEKSLDQFFRAPTDKQPLQEVPNHLSQMRGVFSVLGLDQASLATMRMRSSVEQMLVDEIDVATARVSTFEKLGNSLGALSLLIDMLSYQRAMAKKLFVYDDELGELKPLMGRERVAHVPAVDEMDVTAPAALAAASTTKPSPQVLPSKAAAPVTAPAAMEGSEDDQELLEIFLEEAREVIANGLSALEALGADPSNLADLTTLRRAFHTLKGSSRMVGLNDFGEAAWAFEQMLNAWLADQKPASAELLSLGGAAMHAFARWIEDITHESSVPWNPAGFRATADAYRLEGRYEPPAWAVAAQLPAEEAQASGAFAATEMGGLDDLMAPDADEPQGFAATQLSTIALSVSPPSMPEHDPLGIELDFGVPNPAVAAQDASRRPEFELTQPVTSPAVAESTAAEPSLEGDLGDFDFSDVGAAQPDFDSDETLRAPLTGDVPPFAEIPVQTPDPQAGLDAAEALDEQVKVIGHLRLSIPFYNVYLNEADEWSRRLQVELSEWAMELHQPVPQSSITLAHSLTGSSATVGFEALANLARLLEHAMEHVRHQRGTAAMADAFSAAAEDIRRLLHQFAAGFLKEAAPGVAAALQAVLDLQVPPDEVADTDELDDYSSQLDSEASGLSSVPEPEAEPGAVPAHAAIPQTVSISEAGSVEVPAETPPEELAEESSEQPVFQRVAEPFAQPIPMLRQAAPLAEAAAVASAAEADANLAIVEAAIGHIDVHDRLEPDLVAIFQDEAAELMPALGTALRQWVARPDNNSARSEVLRVLHTLKGSARLAGAMRLGEMAHRVESGIEQLGSEPQSGELLEPLLTQYDALQITLDSLGKVVAQAASAPAAVLEVDAPEAQMASRAPVPTPELPQAPATPITLTPTGALAPIRPVANQTVRVRSQLLDRLLNQAGEVMISRSRLDSRFNVLKTSLGELSSNLERLRQQLRDVEVQAESQMQSRLALSRDTQQGFDPLEFDRFTRVQELTRMMAESVNDVGTVQRTLQRELESAEDDLIAQARQARELQRDLLRTRMVEFDAIADRLHSVIRQAGKEAGKHAQLSIVGGSIEMDRGVLDRMTPAFEHILRNAVAHGIEEPAARAATGKPEMGTITVSVLHEGNDVFVTFSDDGGGLHLERIRAKAIERKLLAPDEPFSEAQAAQLLFAPGFTTAQTVTELSGRGIGMDVVSSEVNALGGRIETATQQGRGTSFRLVLPLTTAVTQVVMLRMGDFTFGVPANLMENVLRIPQEQVDSAYATHHIDVDGQSLPFYWAGALLHTSARSMETRERTASVVLFRSAGQRLALHVDEVLGNREVVVKNLGPQLARLPGLAGMSVLASGAVVLIYNPVALAAVYGQQARGLVSGELPATSTHWSGGVSGDAAQDDVPLILVVDDSITVRRVTQRLLKREGFRVALASDGLNALEKLQEERPTVVLSDIEMPRMDGFDLARNIRADARWKDLPIIMITSRIAQKHRDHAAELGVDHYLGKPYSEEELLGLIRAYCGTTAAG